MTINWDITTEDHNLIDVVVERVLRELDYPDNKLRLIMDLTACHSNGCPLDLLGLTVAPLDLLAHDIYGIRRHINRDTGKLEDFLPRLIRGGNRLAEVIIARTAERENQ